MSYTAEEVRKSADWLYQWERKAGARNARAMLTAYADLLERIKADEEAMPAYWAAIGEKEPDGSGGEIVLAYPADDGNDGEAARTECNQYINDAMLNERVRLRLVPLFTHPPVQAAPVDESAALAHFTDYFVRNYPGPDTIIHDPRWHAPKIFRAAQYALARFATQQADR